MRKIRGFAVLIFTVVAAALILCVLAALPDRHVLKGG